MPSDQELSSLLQGLAAPDPAERRSAAEDLGSADERAIYPLIRTLHDENPGVQDAAMRSLIAIGGEVTAYMTLPLLRESPFLRNTARIILKQIGPAAVPLLRPLLADKDDDIRTFAIDLIADIGVCDYPQEITRLLEADPNQNVRSSAARALGSLAYTAGLPALAAAVKDNEWVAFSALEALSVIRDETSVDAVLPLLSSPSETLRYAAIETLGKIGSPRSSSALIAKLATAGDIEKSAIVRSLVQIGITPSMAEVADLLLNLYVNGEWEDRLVALAGLGDLQYRRAIPAILDVAGSLDTDDPASEERLDAVRQALMKFNCAPELINVVADPAVKFRGKVIAIEVIGELNCREAVSSLVAALGTDLREVRRAAVAALARIAGDEAIAVLRRCIDDRDGRVRSAAITGLANLDDRASFDILFHHLAVENYADVLEDAVAALLRLDPLALLTRFSSVPQACKETVARFATDTDILLALSRETDDPVRIAALTNLGRSGDERAGLRLIDALQDTNSGARRAAVAALGSRNCGVEILGRALTDPDREVRLSAIRAVANADDRDAATRVLVPLLYDPEPSIVLTTIDALVQLGRSDTVHLAALRNHADAEVRERVAGLGEPL